MIQALLSGTGLKILFVLALVGGAVYQYEHIKKVSFAEGFGKATLEYKQKELDAEANFTERLQIAIGKSDEKLAKVVLERNIANQSLAGVRLKIRDLETQARLQTTVTPSTATEGGEDPIGMLAELSNRMAENGPAISEYADSNLARLINCNTEHNAGR